MQNRIFLTAILSATALASAAAATTTDQSADATDFARTLAATARSAEANASPRDAASIQREVASTVEELIVTAAKPPANVRVALQKAVYVCIRPAEIERQNFNCPTTASGLAGLQDVLTTVTALIDGAATASVDGPGSPAFTPPPHARFGAAGPRGETAPPNETPPSNPPVTPPPAPPVTPPPPSTSTGGSDYLTVK